MRFGNSPPASSGQRLSGGTVAPAAQSPPTIPGGGSGSDIPEEQVEFDDESGHTHEGGSGTGTPVPISGDVTGDNTATVVAGLQTTPVDATPPTTGDVLTFDGSNWVPTAPSAGVPLFSLGGWCRANINPITTPSEMFDAAGSQPYQALMLQDGNCLGIGLSLSGDVGGAGVSYTAELYKNGVATGWTVDVVGAAGTQNRSVNISFSEPFIRTDIFTLYDHNAGIAPAAVFARGWILLEYIP